MSSPQWIDKIRADHPRVFFNKETFEAVKSRAWNEEKEWYRYVKNWADGILRKKYPTDWGIDAAVSAFVWLMTKEEKYLEQTLSLLRKSLEWYYYKTDRGESVSWYTHPRVHTWAALDWIWNDISPEIRKEIGGSYLKHVGIVQPE